MAWLVRKGGFYIIVYKYNITIYNVHFSQATPNPFWDSKPELFSDIACLRIPYQPCIVLLGKKFSGTPASIRRELHLDLNVMPTGA